MSLKFGNPILGDRHGINSVSQSGFALPLLIWILPLLILSGGWTCLQLMQLRELKIDRLVCRNALIEAQENAGREISNLLALNMTARRLRLQMTAAKAALALAIASANLPAAKIARASIRMVQNERRALILRQRQLLWSARATLTKGLFQAQMRLRNRYNEVENRRRILFNLRMSGFQNSSARVAVVRSNTPDSFPEYELAPHFSKRQKLSLKWQAKFAQKETGFKRWIPFDQKKMVECGVTLTTHAGVFEAIPAQDKYF